MVKVAQTPTVALTDRQIIFNSPVHYDMVDEYERVMVQYNLKYSAIQFVFTNYPLNTLKLHLPGPPAFTVSGVKVIKLIKEMLFTDDIPSKYILIKHPTEVNIYILMLDPEVKLQDILKLKEDDWTNIQHQILMNINKYAMSIYRLKYAGKINFNMHFTKEIIQRDYTKFMFKYDTDLAKICISFDELFYGHHLSKPSNPSATYNASCPFDMMDQIAALGKCDRFRYILDPYPNKQHTFILVPYYNY